MKYIACLVFLLAAVQVRACSSTNTTIVDVDSTFLTTDNISLSDYPENAIREALSNASLNYDQIKLNIELELNIVSVNLVPWTFFPRCPRNEKLLLKAVGCWVIAVPFVECPPCPCLIDPRYWKWGVCQPTRFRKVHIVLLCPNGWGGYTITWVFVRYATDCGCLAK